MSNISPSKPSFVFGYWRPWNENADFIDSYLDYSKDTSLVKYGADTVGMYINQASKEQVKAINQLGQAIGRGMNVLSNQMSDINETLVFLNRNMDIQVEQQKLSNLLLQNIAELLRVPDSEKERQHSIELGIKFFVNASKDEDLYSDALDELLKAESLMKQDYFVLHRIGCIYLYVNKYINPEKALDYFLRAAKYASVESDPKALSLAKASESYEKAAFSAYVLGKFKDAVKYQSQALKFNNVPKNIFLLAKYQVRNYEIPEAIQNLSKCIDAEPTLASAVFKEIDLINEPEVLNIISKKNTGIDDLIKKLIEDFNKIQSAESKENSDALNVLLNSSYEVKIKEYNKYLFSFKSIAQSYSNLIQKQNQLIDEIIVKIDISFFKDLDKIKLFQIKKELQLLRNVPEEIFKVEFKKINVKILNKIVKIGSKYCGGIVFYLDKSGDSVLVCSIHDFTPSIWGGYGEIGTNGKGLNGGFENTRKIAANARIQNIATKKGWFSKTYEAVKVENAASMCLDTKIDGYEGWYLPTIYELTLIYSALCKKNSKDLKHFKKGFYWSSEESNSKEAKGFNFFTAISDYNLNKESKNNIIAVSKCVRC
jgi:tetratricopeptide (TPR) repeat protein